MTIAMAEPAPTGAPIAKDAIDPELIRLSRKRPQVGLITAAGLVFLCAFFLLKLSPDRRFAGATTAPEIMAEITERRADISASLKLGKRMIGTGASGPSIIAMICRAT